MGGIYMGYMGDIGDIWIYVYARISDLACMHGRIAKTETGVLVPLCVTLGKAVPFLGPSLSVCNNVYLSICTVLLNAYMRYSSSSPEDSTEVGKGDG